MLEKLSMLVSFEQPKIRQITQVLTLRGRRDSMMEQIGIKSILIGKAGEGRRGEVQLDAANIIPDISFTPIIDKFVNGG